METQNQAANQPNEENANTTQTNEQQEKEPRTFTQEEVNKIVQKRVADFADYEDLKAKAAKLDEIEEANKSELQKATEKADRLEAELKAMQNASAIRDIRDEVAKETGVPAGLLTGETKEACEEQANEILAFAKKPAYPQVKDAGEAAGKIKKATRDQFAEWLNSQK